MASAAAIAASQNTLRRETIRNRASSLMVFPRLSGRGPLDPEATRPKKLQQVHLIGASCLARMHCSQTLPRLPFSFCCHPHAKVLWPDKQARRRSVPMPTLWRAKFPVLPRSSLVRLGLFICGWQCDSMRVRGKRLAFRHLVIQRRFVRRRKAWSDRFLLFLLIADKTP
jgi:hypothetical protein